MKLLWITHMLPYPPTGGSLLRTYHLLREASRFARVELVAFVQTSLLSEGQSVEASAAELGRFCRVRATLPIAREGRLGKAALAAACALRGRSYTTSWTDSAEARAATARALDERPDLVLLDTVGLIRCLPPAPLPVPLVLNHHNEEVSMLARRAEQSGSRLLAAYFRLESRRLRAECADFFPRVAVHLVTSELDRLRLDVVGDRPVEAAIVTNGVDTREYADVYSPQARDWFDLLFIGGGTWYPNRDAVDWLVREIWPGIRERIQNSRIVILGRAPAASAVEAARSDPRVVVPGFVSDIRPWAERASVFVCPMRDGGGTRLKLLHAMSMGLPVVSTAMGAEGIDMRDGEHYLRAETPEDFFGAVDRLRTDPQLARRISKSGRDLAIGRYDWSAIGAALEAALQRARERSAPSGGEVITLR